jgi:prepilin-type N-terminal cleavage/methylation domain-containing protein
MAQKYTILKVLIQHLNKFKKSDKGFTLLELIFGLTIMVIVGGLAMNAFISASSDFNKDKKSIDSSQNLSAILEMIGNDIKQSGELISDSSFPTIEFTTNTDTGSMSGSSKVIIRRAVSDPLTLCQSIAASTDPTTLTTLLVADTTATTVAASANCNSRTADNPLLVVRPATVYPTSPATTLPGTKLALTLPVVLRKARDYRCKLDELNPTVAYDSSTRVAQDFCDSSALEKVRIAVSDRGGRILIFNQTDETADGGNTADTVSTGVVKKYGITVEAAGTVSAANDALGMNKATIDTNTKNKTVAYNIGSPIYLLEERVYSLTSSGEFQVSVNGKAPATLIKKIANFRVSARGYTNATDGAVNPTPANDVCTNAAPFSDQPATVDATIDAPQYICKFNYNGLTSDPAMNWKMIAGVKIELQAKYDGTGGATAPITNNDADKLKAAAEYFPRNVLSK